MASTAKVKPVGPELVQNGDPRPKTKTSKPLPFARVAFAKQLEILRGFAAASAQGTKGVTIVELASIVEMAPETISMCNAFFVNVGFIQKGERAFIVSQEVQAFFRAYDWNKETASHKLAPLLQESWFGKALLRKLSFKPIDQEEAIALLADEVAAGPGCKRQLELLIEYLEAGGLVTRDGSIVKIRQTNPTDQGSIPQDIPREQPKDGPVEANLPRPKVATAFSQMAQGAMRFNVSFDVDLSEMANWRADRIAAFFSGIAQVLAAKAEVEKTAGL